MIKITAFDFEASSLTNGFPVSIGVVRYDGAMYHALVKPHADWLTPEYEWNPTSAQIHGYSIAHLQAHGKTPAQIVEELNELFPAEALASDAPAIDAAWLRTLVDAADAEAHFTVRRVDLGAVLSMIENEVGLRGDARREIDRLRLSMHTHNALSDAASWIAALQAVEAWAVGKDLRRAKAVFETWRERVGKHLAGQQMLSKYDGALRELAKGS
jgi:hypothetical protein